MIYSEPQFEHIYRCHYRQMYRWAYSLLEDGEDARDAVSQVFAQMWQSKPEVAEESITSYLMTATRNQCLKLLTRRERQEQMQQDLQFEQHQPQDSARRELLSELHHIIREHLTEQDRRVLALHFDEEMTYSEAAKALSVSPAAINKHITKSLAKIRKILKINQ